MFADIARIFAGLGSLGSQFVGISDPKISGEYYTASVFSMQADFGAAAVSAHRLNKTLRASNQVREYLTHMGVRREREIAARIERLQNKAAEKARGASIILWTLAAVEGAELTTGIGPPANGDDLTVGSDQFTALSLQLKWALPGDSWQGAASEAYADRNAEQQDRAQTMAELDSQLAALVQNQADWVTHMRLGFGMLKELLLAAYFVELLIRSVVPPPVGLATSCKFAIFVSLTATILTTGMLETLAASSVKNGQQADDLTEQYKALAAGAVSTGTRLPQADLVVAAESRVSGFEDISASMSGSSAGSDGSRLAGGSGDQRARLSARAGDGDGSGDDTSDKTGVESTSGMPTLAQLTAMSGQAAKLSGHVSQQMNLLNQSVGQVQQLAAMAQQARGAAAPIEEAAAEKATAEEAAVDGAAPAEALQGAEAAVGTEGAERAPVEDIRLAAVGGQQVGEPRPLDHIGWRR